jgi:FkbM family methyltransferase
MRLSLDINITESKYLVKTIIIKEHTIIEEYLIGKPLNIIDMGACLGEFSEAIRNGYTLNRAILVEANPTNYKQLPTHSNYVVVNNAVSNIANSVLQFREDVNSPYNGSLVFDYFPNAVVHNIPTITLSELIALSGAKEIDILKIDIEGAEYDVLSNAKPEDLQKCKQITVEFHDFVNPIYKSENVKIEKMMLNLGFRVIKKGIKYKNGSDYYDTLFYK